MEPNKHKRLRKTLQRQAGWGQLALLGIVGVSLINQVMLMLGINYHFLFSAAMPYYLNWLAFQLSNAAFSVAAVLMTVVLYGAYGLCLLRSSELQWFWIGMILYAVDTVLLIIFALVLLENPVSCLLELLIHGLALAILACAWKARLRLSRMPRRAPQTP